MSVGEFWQQQECVIKRSYQNYNIVLNINNVKIPVSLIGCGCPNEIVDIYQMYTFIVNVHNDSIFINGQPETLSGLSGYTYSIYSKHRHSEARDYFFLIKPESTQDMQFAAKVIAAIYTAYIIHMHYDELYENCINLMSPEEIKHMKRNNKAMLMLKPSDYESGYCENCNCAEINNKLAL
ncbi:hypothetical protein SDC9_56147 [bioreactor metagenome]|uniref:Uncharacterized protein n=1 Tax=bioreactor metagenome TaxID=1076179 RepID=A0A644X6N8_9ZZZZ